MKMNTTSVIVPGTVFSQKQGPITTPYDNVYQRVLHYGCKNFCISVATNIRNAKQISTESEKTLS